jgi:L-2-hydroxyglutarate oxidase LhgO
MGFEQQPVEGRHLLYEFCERYRVPHQRIGKVIVAVCEGEAPSIERLCTRGLENGVEGLRLLV